jgi:septal ring factor EnvC (AmiA/AmiB activator)
MDVLTIVIALVTGVLVPAIGHLFKRFGAVDEGMDKLETKLDAEREERRKLELMIAREYVSQVALEKIMAPMQKDVNNLERLIERIATRLHIPPVAEE